MTPDSLFAGPDESPGFLLWRVASGWQRRQRAALDPLGLTHAQFVLLAGVGWLGRAGGPVTQAGLARHTHTDEMMTSQVVRGLAGRGLLARRPHPADGRAKGVTLTPAGAALLGRALPVVEGVDAAFFAAAGAGLPGLLAGFRQLLGPDERPA